MATAGRLEPVGNAVTRSLEPDKGVPLIFELSSKGRRGADPEPHGPPPPGHRDREHDRQGLDHLDRAGEERRQHDDDVAHRGPRVSRSTKGSAERTPRPRARCSRLLR